MGAFIGVIVVLAAFIALLVPPTIDGFAELNASIGQVVTDLQKTAAGFGLDHAKLQEVIVNIQTYLSGRGSEIATGAWTGVRTFGEIVVGGGWPSILAVYLVHGGDHLVHWVADLAPRGSRWPTSSTPAGVVFDVVGRYVRGVAAVGFVDAFFIGITLWILGVPIALPLAVPDVRRRVPAGHRGAVRGAAGGRGGVRGQGVDRGPDRGRGDHPRAAARRARPGADDLRQGARPSGRGHPGGAPAVGSAVVAGIMGAFLGGSRWRR